MSISEQLETIASNSTKTAAEVTKILEQVSSRYDALSTKIDNYNVTSSRLYRKKFGMLGDSYVAYNNGETAYKYVAAKYSMTYYNYGINGNTVGYPTYNSALPMSERYVDMVDDLDYIGFVGGHNDASKGTPIGTPEDSTNTTFMGALNLLASGLIEKYLGKKIFAVTPWNIDDTRDLYNEAILKIFGEKWGIPVLDADKYSGMHMKSSAWRTMYSSSSGDTAHLNANGSRLYMDVVESFMLQL